MFEVRDVGFRLDCRGAQRWLFRGVNFDIAEGEAVALMGASGSGKSTLLNGVSGLGVLTEGSSRLDGGALSRVPQRVLRRNLRTVMSVVFQQHHLVPGLTLLQNVELSWSLSGKTSDLHPDDILDVLEIGDERHSLPESVSGGQAQRAAIARSLVTGSKLLFADEPTGSLDSENSRRVMDQIARLCRERGSHALIVTHDKDVAARCHRVLVLDGGEVRDGQGVG